VASDRPRTTLSTREPLTIFEGGLSLRHEVRDDAVIRLESRSTERNAVHESFKRLLD